MLKKECGSPHSFFVYINKSKKKVQEIIKDFSQKVRKIPLT
ncbi:hypothetical protein lbkm_2803 [Lachnospiraceae bacterium KM106-2]|nr:hypothetical protein lbkm_2803 [Lachnospiraceae bacterium KM106-2]